jgi:hypothetical protein
MKKYNQNLIPGTSMSTKEILELLKGAVTFQLLLNWR